MKQLMLLVINAILFSFSSCFAGFSTGALDRTFNPSGTFPGVPGVESIFPIAANFGTGAASTFANALALQANLNIVAAGFAHPTAAGPSMSVVRLLPNGSLDTTFNTGQFPGTPGVLTIPLSNYGGATSFAEAFGVAIQNDQNIVIAGYATDTPANPADTTMSIVRLTTTGGLDIGFNQAGIFPGVPGVESIWSASFGPGTTQSKASALAIQGNQMIVVVGNSTVPAQNISWAVVRLTTAGALDGTFNTNASTGYGAPGVASIYTASFGNTSGFANAVVIDQNQNIVVVGAAGLSQMGVVRLTTTGGFDPSFNPAGPNPGVFLVPNSDFGAGITFPTTGATAVALQPNGQIVMVGQTNTDQMAVIRLNANGSVDTTFGNSGTLLIPNSVFGTATSSNPTSVQIESDGKIVIGGQAQVGIVDSFAIVRLTSSGILDTTFNPSGALPGGPGGEIIPNADFSATSNSSSTAMLIQPDNKILLTGSSTPSGTATFAFARLGACQTVSPLSPLAQTIFSLFCNC